MQKPRMQLGTSLIFEEWRGGGKAIDALGAIHAEDLDPVTAATRQQNEVWFACSADIRGRGSRVQNDHLTRTPTSRLGKWKDWL